MVGLIKGRKLCMSSAVLMSQKISANEDDYPKSNIHDQSNHEAIGCTQQPLA